MNISKSTPKMAILFAVIFFGGVFLGGIEVASAWFVTGSPASCSTSHICYDPYPCNSPSQWNYDTNKACPNNTINCDNYSDCGNRTPVGGSLYYACGYDSTSCTPDTQMCYYQYVTSWNACSNAGIQTANLAWAAVGGTSCSDAPSWRTCTPPVPATMSNVSHSCLNGGTQAMITWSGQNATSYAVRFNYGGNAWHPDSCAQVNPWDVCQNRPHVTNGNYMVVNVSPGVPNSMWVHAYNATGYSAPISQAFTCNAPVTDGACDFNRAKTHDASATMWPVGSNYCTKGTASVSPAFPNHGSSVSWICQGSGGGASPTCNAGHKLPSPTVDLKINGSNGPINPNKDNGDNLDISWTVTPNVIGATTYCNKSGDSWGSGEIIPSRPLISSDNNLPLPSGSYPIDNSLYSLTCQNRNGNSVLDSNSVTDQVAVSVYCTPGPDTWTNCSKSCGTGTKDCSTESNRCVTASCGSDNCNIEACPVSSEWKEVAN